MKRRQFIRLLGAAAAWPLAAYAQQPAMPVVGILAVVSLEANALRMRAFREALSAAGYVDGQNVQTKYRRAEAGRLPELAAQLAQDQVAVLVAAGGTASALAAKAATATIPIVFAIGADPVQIGLVASLNRPGGNATGATSINTELGPKRLELMRELLPSVSTMALLVNPTTPALAEPSTRISQAAAHALGLELHVLQARSEHDFDPTFAKLVELRARPWTMNTSFDNSAKTTAGPWDAASPRSAILSSRAWIARLRSSIARSFPCVSPWTTSRSGVAARNH